MRMDKKKKRKIIGAIILFILVVLYTFLGVVLPEFAYVEYNETNTAEYTATVKDIEEDEEGYKIFLNEYQVCLAIEPYQLESPDALRAIGKNDKIVFRVISKEYFELPYAHESGVLSLKSSDTEFISLESSAQIVKRDKMRAKIIGITVAALSLGGAVTLLCIALFKRKDVNG